MSKLPVFIMHYAIERPGEEPETISFAIRALDERDAQMRALGKIHARLKKPAPVDTVFRMMKTTRQALRRPTQV